MSCFTNICTQCHMPSLTNRDDDFCCYGCKCTIHLKTQAIISCKVKHENGKFVVMMVCYVILELNLRWHISLWILKNLKLSKDFFFCDPWIKSSLAHKLVNLEEFKTKQRFFLCLFHDKYLEGCFVLNLTIEVVGYSMIKVD